MDERDALVPPRRESKLPFVGQSCFERPEHNTNHYTTLCWLCMDGLRERLANIRERGQNLEDWKAQAVSIVQELMGRVATLEQQRQNLAQRVAAIEQRLGI